ncbi:hypothetical protein PC128_g22645 [Phytophthora cactorum]|nr:hypothetical protein PC120_g21063 [Phytophthora cactorum]KAG3153030.1 hypothetical protein PC128_g22645 [Phytophthora cactorum]KAG4040478.1 hypothetical protein PC123_g23986 [Phytophthora cactorum]
MKAHICRFCATGKKNIKGAIREGLLCSWCALIRRWNRMSLAE